MTIRPCPKCNGTGQLKAKYNYRLNGYLVSVKCKQCGEQGDAYIDEENPVMYYWETPACQEAIFAWNRHCKPSIHQRDDK